MEKTHRGKKRPAHGRQARQQETAAQLRRIREQEREDELSLTKMIQTATETAALKQDDELSLTSLIQTVTETAAQRQEDDLSIASFIQSATKEAADREDDLSLDSMIRTEMDKAVEKTDGHSLNIPAFKAYIEVHPDEDEVQPKKTGGIWKALFLVCLFAAAFFAGLYLYPLLQQKQNAAVPGEPEREPETAPAESSQPVIEPQEEPGELDELKNELTYFLADAEGEWSVYVEDLKTGESIIVNDEQMSAASLIKLFTAGRYLEALEKGDLTETELSAYWLEMMITWSDNDAWEQLETYIGHGDYNAGLMAVTDFAIRHDCPYSGREIGTETIFDYDADNLTKASEIGKVLHEIYEGTYVSKEASERLYKLLGEQNITYKIGSGLPEGFEFASKSGELPGVENDAAIVRGSDTDYILVILSNEVYDGEEAVDNILEITYMCSAYLNPSINQ